MFVCKPHIYRPFPTDEQERWLGQCIGAVDAAVNVLRRAGVPELHVGGRATESVEAGSSRRVA